MIKTSPIRKIAFAGVLIALGVVGSLFSFPLLGSRCAPVQHFINIVAAVTLGPWYGLGMAFCTSLLRISFGLGTLLAFPGSMCGAFLAGMLFRAFRHPFPAFAGELVGTSVLGGLLSFPIAVQALGLSPENGIFVFVVPFFLSSAVGCILAVILLFSLHKTGIWQQIRKWDKA